MYTGSVKSKILVHASNIPGWRTRRKIVVIESDDWGSIRTAGKKNYEAMLASGLDVDKSVYTKNDSLESNDDLEILFETLASFKDSGGRSPVFTPLSIMANPDFKKIRETDFREYHYENFTETCKSYPNHDRVAGLWLKGIEERLFVPEYHGREHLNVKRWMNALKNRNKALTIAFENHSIGVSSADGIEAPEYLAAFYPETPSEIPEMERIIETGAELFKNNCGYSPRHFVASNSPEPKSLEKVLAGVGIKYITKYKIQNTPLGDNKFRKEINWLGKRNSLSQTFMIRNCFYEPSYGGDWQDRCLKEMEIAFAWNKPAIIITHRVNYVGSVNPGNRDESIKNLKALLTRMLKKWPEIEFMTTPELGDLIAG